MKKILLSLSLVILAFSNINAQNNISFGVKGGLTLANISGFEEDLTSRTSFHLGGFVEYVINEKFSFQPELLFSNQGTKATYEDNFGGISIKEEELIKLSYINLPLLAKYKIIDQLSVLAGPQVGFLVAAKYEVKFEETFEGVTESETLSQDASESFKTLDLGLNFGLEYELPMGLRFDVNYVFGLSNISSEDIGLGDDFSLNNRVLQVSVGYRF